MFAALSPKRQLLVDEEPQMSYWRESNVIHTHTHTLMLLYCPRVGVYNSP